MNTRILSWNTPLKSASRLQVNQPLVVRPISLSETGMLLLCGMGAALAVLMFEFKLKIPGHAILRAVFPMAFGLALVPRRGAGTMMGAGAATTAAVILLAGWGEKGLGSLTSLFLMGPFLDFAMNMNRSASGPRVYVSLIAAGMMTNLAALAVQGSAKYYGWAWAAGGGGKSLATWLSLAALTYPLCGALAGLLSAAAWFRWNSDPRQDPGEELA